MRLPYPPAVSANPARCCEAVIGLALGSAVSGAMLAQLGAVWLPVTIVILGTLACAMGIGLLFRRSSGLDTATAILASLPGGTVGLVVVAREMGGDDRVVAFSQYLRILVILVTTPFLASTLANRDGVVSATAESAPKSLTSVLVALAAGIAGWWLARKVRLPVPALLGPMLAAATLSVVLPRSPAHVPAALLNVAFGLVGLDVGLRFTGELLRQLRALLRTILLSIALLLASSFLLALLFCGLTGVALLDGYLATTPGGITVVAAAAYGTGANTALVMAIQMLRVVLMLLATPALVRLATGVSRHGAAARAPSVAPVVP